MTEQAAAPQDPPIIPIPEGPNLTQAPAVPLVQVQDLAPESTVPEARSFTLAQTQKDFTQGALVEAIFPDGNGLDPANPADQHLIDAAAEHTQQLANPQPIQSPQTPEVTPQV